MSDSRDLAAHLKYYRELGVEGISRDAAWRRRAGDSPAAQDGTLSSAANGATGQGVPVQLVRGRV